MKKSIILTVAIMVLGALAFVRVSPFFSPTVEALYAAYSLADMKKDAEIIVLGQVTKIGNTRWNQNNELYWEGGMPYYEVVVNVQKTVVGESSPGDELILTAFGSSPVDLNIEQAIGELENTLSSGQQIIIFAEQREFAWRESSRMPVVTFMGGPNQGVLTQDVDGYYTSVHGPKFTLEQLVNEVQEVRNISK